MLRPYCLSHSERLPIIHWSKNWPINQNLKSGVSIFSYTFASLNETPSLARQYLLEYSFLLEMHFPLLLRAITYNNSQRPVFIWA